MILNMDEIQNHLFPDLTHWYFGSPNSSEYEAAFNVANTSSGTIYYSETQRNPESTTVDAVMNIFGPPPGSTEAHFWQAARTLTTTSGTQEYKFTSPVWFPVIRYTPLDGDWNLVLKRRQASVSSMLAAARHKNLAVSLGILFLLAVSMALVILASQRAQRLARLQMEFVASVSHELRTPLAVIRSAAENITDGVIGDETQLAQYGAAIKKQTVQLTDLVEQVLLFASTRKLQPHVTLRPIAPEQIVASALASTSELIRQAGIELEQNITPNLPNVMGDLPALSRCLQNLLVNAAKYGGENHWIGIEADARDDEIQITVHDRGPGIRSSDLPHIFKAFYRSPSVVTAQIHGTGLGLALARSVAEAMGGKLTVKSVLGQGSSFTLHLPALDSPARPDNLVSVKGDRTQ